MSNPWNCLRWYIEAYRLQGIASDEEIRAHAATWRDEWADWSDVPPAPGAPAPTD